MTKYNINSHPESEKKWVHGDTWNWITLDVWKYFDYWSFPKNGKGKAARSWQKWVVNFGESKQYNKNDQNFKEIQWLWFSVCMQMYGWNHAGLLKEATCVRTFDSFAEARDICFYPFPLFTIL